MAFLVILRRTLIDLTGPVGNLVIWVIGVGLSVLLSLAMGFDFSDNMSAEMQSLELLGDFLITTFIWGAGFFLAITVSVKGAGLIARESSESTLTLLVARPVDRWQIVAGKFAALVIYGVLMDFIVLLSSALILALIRPVTDDTIMMLLSAIVRLLPYILLVTVVFASISIALSTVTARRIGITAVMCIIVAGIFLIGPVVTGMITDNTDNKNDSYDYFDLSKHFGDLYYTVVRSVEGGHVIPEVYVELSRYLIEDGLEDETLPATGYSDLPIGRPTYPMEISLKLSPVVSLVFWLSVMALSLGVAFRAMERKQIS